ncbi:MAG: C25 family cysteine peptidase, partial [Bacteroidota bacterium]
MYKKLFLHISLLLLLSGVQAQNFFYGNDWYKAEPNRTYIKLIVDTDGIYRVSLADLQNAGHDLSTVNPDNLRLLYRGKEVPLYTEKNGNTLTYLEFFGERNNGSIDSIMYRDPNTGKHVDGLQPNKNLSLFTDESVYYLTWDSSPSGNRYFSNFDPTYSGRTPVSSFLHESKVEYTDGTPGATYIQGGGGPYEPFYTLNCDYGPSEGYVGPSFSFGTARTINIPTPAPANTNAPLDIKMRIFGRSRTQHIFKAELNGNTSNPIIDTTINTSSIYIKTYERSYIPAANLTDDTDITFHALRANTDNNHVAWASIKYQRLPDMMGDSTLRVSELGASTNKVYFRLENAVGDTDAIVYDLRNRFRNVGRVSGGVAEVLVQGFPNTRDLFMATDRGIRKPRIENSSLNRLFDPNQGADYVIITHRGLASSAAAYANYRDTATVTPINSVKIVYVDEIYDEYSYGSITPWAIKRFCKDAIDNWVIKPRYFLLWGKGKYRLRNLDTNLTLVPTFGFPATDYEFISHFDQNSSAINPEASIGRVNLFSDAEGLEYLKKVDQYEHTPWDSWMKKGTFLGGGGTLGEQNAISNAFNFMIDVFEGKPYGGSSFYFQKNSAQEVIDPEAASYHDEISQGVSVIHFFGHSTSNINDVSIREPFEYNNFGRYPIMLAMGCFGGDFTVGQSFGERWLLESNRGSIAYIGNSSAGYLNPLRDYGKVFYRILYDQALSQPLGDAIRNTIDVVNDSLAGIQYRNHSRQMNLQGDPAIIMYAPTQADIEINEPGIFFEPENFTAQDESFDINVIIRNLGLIKTDSFELKITQRLPDNSVKEHVRMKMPMEGFVDTFTYTITNTFGNTLAGQNF